MSHERIFAGKRKHPKRQYKAVPLEFVVGKTVEAVVQNKVEGAWGLEDCINLYFTDKTWTGFVLASDE